MNDNRNAYGFPQLSFVNIEEPVTTESTSTNYQVEDNEGQVEDYYDQLGAAI